MSKALSSRIGAGVLVATGLGLVALTTAYVLTGRSQRKTSRGSIDDSDKNEQSDPPAIVATEAVVALLERTVQRDEGGRGITNLVIPGELLQGTREILRSSKVAILTGFPCLLDCDPPTETDGPLGAFAIAKALLALGKEVCVLTDECNADCVMACTAGSGLDGTRLSLEAFPPAHEWGGREDTRLLEIAENVDFVIAIERPGPAEDLTYRTMRGLDMTNIVAPLERILDIHAISERDVKSFGIGDGGNELGMGKVLEKILRSGIPRAQEIACVVPFTYILACSVSNWGGYALAAALAVCAHDDATQPRRFLDRAHAVSACLPSEDEEEAMALRLVQAGARDGITKKAGDPWVDGMPMSESLRVLRELRDIASTSNPPVRHATA